MVGKWMVWTGVKGTRKQEGDTPAGVPPNRFVESKDQLTLNQMRSGISPNTNSVTPQSHMR